MNTATLPDLRTKYVEKGINFLKGQGINADNLSIFNKDTQKKRFYIFLCGQHPKGEMEDLVINNLLKELE